MTVPDADEVFAALRQGYAWRLARGGSLVDIRRSGLEAVFVFRWDPLPDLFGVPVPLTETDRRLDWDQPAADFEDWLESVDLWLMEDVENGMHWRGARRRVGDYIELRYPGWPSDDRFAIDAVAPDDQMAWLRSDFVARDGLDSTKALQRRAAGHLVTWITAYENNSTGSPYVGQATVISDGSHVGHLDTLEVVDHAPPFLVVNVARAAAHTAAEQGCGSVWTDLDIEHSGLAGFRRDPAHRRMTVNTSFLDEDPRGATDLLLADLAESGRWGEDGDRANRYLPRTRLGRVVHRLRYGRSGRPWRLYAG